MKTSCLRLKLVELNFLVSFNTDDQSKTDVANAINIITYQVFNVVCLFVWFFLHSVRPKLFYLLDYISILRNFKVQPSEKK